MLRLQEQLQGDFLPVYIDMQGLRDSSTHQFLYQLMSRISIAFKEKTEREITTPAFNKTRKDPLSYFDTFMARIQQATQNHPLIVILDEFQCLCSLREDLVSREAIFSRLRSHSQHGRSVRFILSGGGPRRPLTTPCGKAPLFYIVPHAK